MHRDKRATRHTLNGNPGSDIITPDDDDDAKIEPETKSYMNDDNTLVIEPVGGDESDDDDDEVDHEERIVLDYERDDDYSVHAHPRTYLADGPGDEVEGDIIVPELADELAGDYKYATGDVVVGKITWAYYFDRMTLRHSPGPSIYDPDVPDGQKVAATADDGYFIVHDTDTDSSDSDGDDSPEPLTGGWEGLDWDEYMRIRQSKTVEPADGQHRLKDYRGATQEEVNPDAIPADELVDDLPAFIDLDNTTEITKKAKDPTTGSLNECDHCHEPEPWHHPLERGVHGVRPGSPDEGPPNREPCESDDIKLCECCGCPFCGGKSIRHRMKNAGTDDPTFACNSCKHEFDNPVERPDGSDAERTRLFWRCGECGAATRAPFDGIPRDLVSDGSRSQ